MTFFTALKEAEGHFLFNGDNSISMQHKTISVQGVKVDYSGASAVIESISSVRKMPIALEVYVSMNISMDTSLFEMLTRYCTH